MGFKASDLHTLVYWNESRCVTVVVHVEYSICVGSTGVVTWLSDGLKKTYDLKRHVLEPESKRAVKHIPEQAALVCGALGRMGVCPGACQSVWQCGLHQEANAHDERWAG